MKKIINNTLNLIAILIVLIIGLIAGSMINKPVKQKPKYDYILIVVYDRSALSYHEIDTKFIEIENDYGDYYKSGLIDINGSVANGNPKIDDEFILIKI